MSETSMKFIDINGLSRYHELMKNMINALQDSIVDGISESLMTSDEKNKLDYTNIAYGTCSTSASTAAKVVNLSSDGTTNWELKTGSIISVKFSSTNTASNPTLNVNGTGAKSVVYNTSKITTSSLSYAGYKDRVLNYLYDGTNYVFIGWSYQTAYSSMTESEANAGTSTTSRLITPQRLHNKVINEISEAVAENGVIANAIKDYTDTEIANLTAEIENTEEAIAAAINYINDKDIKVVNKGSDKTTCELLPNTFYVWETIDQLDITLGAEIYAVYNEYMFQFTSGETPTTLILPDDIQWVNEIPQIEANKTYQCSIVNKIAVICGV